MNFTPIYQTKNGQDKWINVIRYFSVSLLIAVIFCYIIFLAKAYFLQQQINELEQKIFIEATPAQQASQTQIQNYKMQIADYTTLISNHKISSKVFDFIEQNTLPSISFSSFNLSLAKNDLSISGHAENMAALSNQINIFEGDTRYVKSINVLNSTASNKGNVVFTLDISLNPDIVNYQP